MVTVPRKISERVLNLSHFPSLETMITCSILAVSLKISTKRSRLLMEAMMLTQDSIKISFHLSQLSSTSLLTTNSTRLSLDKSSSSPLMLLPTSGITQLPESSSSMVPTNSTSSPCVLDLALMIRSIPTCSTQLLMLQLLQLPALMSSRLQPELQHPLHPLLLHTLHFGPTF